MLQRDVKAPSVTPSDFLFPRNDHRKEQCAKDILLKTVSSLHQLWHQLWEYPGGKKLNPDAIQSIFGCPKPTGTLNVASGSGDTSTFSRKRTTATARNSTSVTHSQPKRLKKAYEKESKLG